MIVVGTLEDVGTLEVIEVLERLDFDTVCDAKDCDDAAVWVGRLSCCGFTFVVCEVHRRRDDAMMRRAEAFGLTLEHNHGESACGHAVACITWTPLRGES